MDLEILKFIFEGGFSAVVVYMLYDMRREAREQREQTWTLLTYLIQRQYPDVDMEAVTARK